MVSSNAKVGRHGVSDHEARGVANRAGVAPAAVAEWVLAAVIGAGDVSVERLIRVRRDPLTCPS